MSKLSVVFLRIALVLCFVSALVATKLTAPNINVIAQSDKVAKPEAQEAKPFDQEKALAELRKAIAGQENKPASEVFKNILMLKQMPAARLLKVMELGYSRSLGVTCTHCHVADQWEKDDKPAKPIAREMMTMVGAINNDYLAKIKNLSSEAPIINCTTCHRGQLKPALNLPEDKPK